MTRNYLPTLSQLIDRLSIVTLKSIKIFEHKEEYEKEAHEIMKDIDLLLEEKTKVKYEWGQFVRGILMVMLSNNTIWENESFVRNGEKNMKAEEVAKYLTFTHSMNRVRNQAMNVISNLIGERKELKLDYMDAEITKRMGYDCGSVFL
jgi:hypothetical protein